MALKGKKFVGKNIKLIRRDGRLQVVDEPEEEQDGILSAIQDRLREGYERVRETPAKEFFLPTATPVKRALAKTGEAVKEAVPHIPISREGSEMLGGLAEKSEGFAQDFWKTQQTKHQLGEGIMEMGVNLPGQIVKDYAELAEKYGKGEKYNVWNYLDLADLAMTPGIPEGAIVGAVGKEVVEKAGREGLEEAGEAITKQAIRKPLPKFTGFSDRTTKLLDMLVGQRQMPKSQLTKMVNSPKLGLKKQERALWDMILEEYTDEAQEKVGKVAARRAEQIKNLPKPLKRLLPMAEESRNITHFVNKVKNTTLGADLDRLTTKEYETMLEEAGKLGTLTGHGEFNLPYVRDIGNKYFSDIIGESTDPATIIRKGGGTGDIQVGEKKIREILEELPDLESGVRAEIKKRTGADVGRIHVYGSRLTGKSHKTGLPVGPKSDLDLAVEIKGIKDINKVSKFAGEGFLDKMGFWEDGFNYKGVNIGVAPIAEGPGGVTGGRPLSDFTKNLPKQPTGEQMIPTKEIANKIRTNTLELNQVDVGTSHSGVTVDVDDVDNYTETVYNSPVFDRLGISSHYSGQEGTEGYFSHVRRGDVIKKRTNIVPKEATVVKGKGGKWHVQPDVDDYGMELLGDDLSKTTFSYPGGFMANEFDSKELAEKFIKERSTSVGIDPPDPLHITNPTTTRRWFESQSDLFQVDPSTGKKKIHKYLKTDDPIRKDIETAESNIKRYVQERKDYSKFNKALDKVDMKDINRRLRFSARYRLEQLSDGSFAMLNSETNRNFRKFADREAADKWVEENMFTYAFKDKLEETTGIGHSYWNYLPDDYRDMRYEVEGVREGASKLDKYRTPAKLLERSKNRAKKFADEAKTNMEIGSEELKRKISQLEEFVLTPERQETNRYLQDYADDWEIRQFREELKQAALDGKTKGQFPTGKTALQIEFGSEGIGEGVEEGLQRGDDITFQGEDFIITDEYGTEGYEAIRRGDIERQFSFDEAVDEEVQNRVVDIESELESVVDGTIFKPEGIDYNINNAINIKLGMNDLQEYNKDKLKYIKDNQEDIRELLEDYIDKEVRAQYDDAEGYAKHWTDETGTNHFADVNDTIYVEAENAYGREAIPLGTADGEIDPEMLSDRERIAFDRAEKYTPSRIKKAGAKNMEKVTIGDYEWWEFDIPPEAKDKPVQSYGLLPILWYLDQQQKAEPEEQEVPDIFTQ